MTDGYRIVLIDVVIVASIAWLFGWVSGWRAAARAFATSRIPTVWLDNFAICVIGNGPMKIPVRVGADDQGLFLAATFPLNLLYPRIFAPWDSVDFHGPRWLNREDIEIGGLPIAVPRRLAYRIKQMKAEYVR